MIRVRSEEVLGKNFREILPGFNEKDPLQIFRTVLRTGTPETIKTMHYQDQRLSQWFQLEIFRLSARKIFIVLHELTSRMESEKTLRFERGIFRKIIETSPVGIILVDPDGRLSFANSQAEKILGLTIKENGKTVYDEPAWTATTVTGKPLDKDDLPFYRVKKTCRPVFAARHAIEKPDRQRVLVSVNAAPVLDKAGRLLGVISSMEDITEQALAEEKLKENERQLRRAQEVAHLGSWSFNFITGLVNASEEARRIYGLDDRILTIEFVKTLPLAEYRAGLDTALKKLIAGEREYNQEFKIKRISDSRTVYIHSIAEYDRKKNMVIGTIQDITERKKTEETFRQVKKMEALGRLAGGIAHDFNNMLNVILGYSDLILERIPIDDRTYHELSEIRSAARRSADLTGQLLAFSRNQSVQPRITSLNETIARQMKILKRMIGEDIEIQFIPHEKLGNILIDPTQIDQILTNLAVNARDAITNVGTVTIETANAVLDSDYAHQEYSVPPGEYIMLAFSDNGTGMDQQTVSQIFEPFFTTKISGKGTGLGLATVYGIVRQNKGLIHTYSEPSIGTTFKLYFPRHLGKSETVEAADPPEVMGGAETILLVEDEKQVLQLSKKILEKKGYTVLAARTPNQALKILREARQPIHLLLTDVVMPEMNGRELQLQVRKMVPGICTLFMSGYTRDVVAKKNIISKDVLFIQKPFSVQALLLKVREALDS